jgi:hypothetical protein
VGRYALAILSPHEAELPRTPAFAGGQRLVGQGVEEDRDIAELEALFWLAATPGSAFLPHLDDPRPRVRLTAAKLVRLAPFPEIEAALHHIAETHPDPAVVWHARDGLDRKTWVPGPNPHRARPPQDGITRE